MKKVLVLLLAVFLGSAFASESSDSKVEWRLLGPAFAHHASLDGAPISKPMTGVWDCKEKSGRLCIGRNVAGERGWSESNPAFGIERSAPSSPGAESRDKLFATFVRDSYGQMSLMAGVGRQWPVATLGTFALSAGISGGLWYRTVSDGDVVGGKICYQFTNEYSGEQCTTVVDDYYVTQLKRVIVPFVLPFLEITERTTGFGANIALAPKMKMGQYETVPTTTLMLQLSYKLDF